MSRIRFSYQGALTVAVWSDDPAERQIVFVTPVEDQPDSNWRPLGVTPTPTYTAQRLTIDMLAAACALHVGILGIPREAEAYVIAPSYRVHWIINRSVLGDELSATELLQNTLPNLAGSGVWIVPTKLPLPSLSVSRLSYLLTKAFRTHKADGPDGPRAADFRDRILVSDNAACVITGEKEVVEAAHIIHRYIGSSIFAAVCRDLCRICSQFDSVPDDVLANIGTNNLLFCDIRTLPPTFTSVAGQKPIDDDCNGQTMAPSPHDHQDLKDAHATHPPTGRVLWFNVASGENLTAFATCGGLASYTTPIGPEGIVYRKRTGIQAMDTLRFHPQCLRFYITLCVHFMPRKIKDAVMTLVVQAGHPLKTVDKSTQTENSDVNRFSEGEGADRMQVDGPRIQTTLATLPGHHDDSPDFISPPLPLLLKHLVSVFVCLAIGTLLAGWAWTGLPGTSLEEPVAELPGTIIAQSSSSPGSTNDSNLSGSSSATLANRPPYEAVKEILAAAEFVPLAEDDEIGAAQVKANLEHLFPDLVLNGYTAIELQRHHQSLVFKAALLLRLSASIQSTDGMPPTT